MQYFSTCDRRGDGRKDPCRILCRSLGSCGVRVGAHDTCRHRRDVAMDGRSRRILHHDHHVNSDCRNDCRKALDRMGAQL